MLLAFAGVTGVGKSFFKDEVVNQLGFEKIRIITTREIRIGEKNNIDKVFVSLEELEAMKNKKQIAYEFELLGNKYAYTNEELFSDRNIVLEMHYECIYDFKKICPNICTIYLLPTDLEVAKNKVKQRKLDSITEKNRILEIEEHYSKITTDESLRNMFDYIVYNNYDNESEQKIIDLVRKIMNKKEK